MILTKLNNINNKCIEKIGIHKYRIIYFIVTFLLSSFLCFIGTSNGHDIEFHLSRIQAIADGVKNGTFPVLIYPNYLNGLGYANGVFYPDLFLYIPAILVIIGIKCDLAYSIFLMIINIASILIMFFVIKRITNDDKKALLISRIYVCSPYYLWDAYVRSSIGELLALAFMPLVIYGLYEIIYRDYKKGGIFYTIGIVCVLSSHLLSTIFCVIITVLFVLFNIKRLIKDIKRIKYLIIYGLFSVGITLYFTAPMIEMMKSDKYLYQTDILYMEDRAIPFTKSFIELSTINEAVNYKWAPQGIGVIYIILFINGIINIIKNRKNIKNDSFYIQNICFGLFFFIFSTSLFPWGKIEFLNIFQFPWRFLGLSCCFLIVGLSNYIEMSNFKISVVGNILTILVVCYTLVCLISNIFIYDYYYIGFNRDARYSIGCGEYIPINFDFDYEKEYELSSNNDIKINYYQKGTSFEIEIENNNYDDTKLEVPLIYYKGYKAKTDNNKNLSVTKSDNGLVEIELNDINNCKIYINYEFTTIRIISSIVSMISIIGFIITIKKEYRLKD